MKFGLKAGVLLLLISLISGCSSAEDKKAAFETQKKAECIILFEGLAKNKAIPASSLTFLNKAAKSDPTLLEIAQQAYEVNTILAVANGSTLNAGASIRLTSILAGLQQFCNS